MATGRSSDAADAAAKGVCNRRISTLASVVAVVLLVAVLPSAFPTWGLFTLSASVHFGAWLGDLVGFLGESFRAAGMILGTGLVLVVGLTLLMVVGLTLLIGLTAQASSQADRLVDCVARSRRRKR